MLSHDVVVVGAGLAGMRAAIAAHEAGVDVALVTKVHPVRSHSGAAQGGVNAALGNQTEDHPDNHTFDTVKGADYIGDQDAIEILCNEAPGEIIQLEHWGAVFSRDETTGKIAQRPFGGAGYPRTCYAADLTGLVMLHTLYTGVREVRDPDLRGVVRHRAGEGLPRRAVAASSPTTWSTGPSRRSARRPSCSPPAAPAASTGPPRTRTRPPATAWASRSRPASR